MTIHNILGWIGMILILIAYYMVSTNKVSGDSRSYQLLNLFGALGILANTFVQKAWPVATLNVIWAVIAIEALLTAKIRAKDKH